MMIYQSPPIFFVFMAFRVHFVAFRVHFVALRGNCQTNNHLVDNFLSFCQTIYNIVYSFLSIYSNMSVYCGHDGHDRFFIVSNLRSTKNPLFSGIIYIFLYFGHDGHVNFN